jgi:hypothetical protein
LSTARRLKYQGEVFEVSGVVVKLVTAPRLAVVPGIAGLFCVTMRE